MTSRFLEFGTSSLPESCLRRPSADGRDFQFEPLADSGRRLVPSSTRWYAFRPCRELAVSAMSGLSPPSASEQAERRRCAQQRAYPQVATRSTNGETRMNEVDRFRPLVDALRDCLGGSADDLILLGRQAQSLIAATSAEAPAMQVRLIYSKLFDVLKSMRMQPG